MPTLDGKEPEQPGESSQDESEEKFENRLEEIKASEVSSDPQETIAEEQLQSQPFAEEQDFRLKEMMASLSREELTALLKSINVEIDKKVIQGVYHFGNKKT